MKLTFALASDGDVETVDPNRWIGLAFRIFGVSLLGTYLLQDPSNRGIEWATQMLIFSGFNAEPYNYFFVPVFLVVGHAFAIGVLLTIVRSTLMRGSGHRATTGLKVVGGVLVLLTWAAFWLVIPQFDTRGAQALMGMVLFPLWVFLAFGLQRRTVLFAAVWIAGLVASVGAANPTAETVANLVIVGMLMFYRELMPGEADYPCLSMRSANVGEARAPWSHPAGGSTDGEEAGEDQEDPHEAVHAEKVCAAVWPQRDGRWV